MSNVAVAEKPKPASLGKTPAPKAEAPKSTAPKTAAPESKITVLKGFKLPPLTRNFGAESKYPWNSLEVGDAFFVSGITTRDFGGLASSTGKRLTKRQFSAEEIAAGKRIKFAVRAGKHEGVEGVFVGRES